MRDATLSGQIREWDTLAMLEAVLFNALAIFFVFFQPTPIAVA